MARLKFLARALLSAGLIVLVVRKVNWNSLAGILAHLQWGPALLGSVLWGALIAALAFRWNIFLRQQSIEVPFRETLSMTWGGQFFNSLLPGSTGGDVFKIYQLCRRVPTRRAAAAASVLVDRFSALVALLALAAAAFIIEPGPLRALAAGRLGLTHVWWLIPAALVAGVLLWLVLRTIASGWWPRVARILAAVRTGLSPNVRVAFAFALAFAIHILNFLSVYLFARALGLDISWRQVLLMMPVVLLLVMLPITINGHGLRELLLIGYMSYMGITAQHRTDVGFQEIAVALSILMVANDLVWSFPGGLRYLTRASAGTQRTLGSS